MKRSVLLVAIAMVFGVSAQTQVKPKVIRFLPNGPAGWAKAGADGTRTHIYYESKGAGSASAGVWEGQPFTKDFKYESSQFMFFLEGSVTLTDKRTMRQDTFKAGDAVVIPRGTEFTWKQTSKLRKYFVEFEREVPAGAKVPAEPPTFIRMEIDGPPGVGMTATAADGGAVKTYRYYSATDRSLAAVWDTAPRPVSYTDTKYSQLMVLLRGSVTLRTADGYQEEFKAGDAMLVPKGMTYTADFQALRKYYVMFDQEPAAAKPSSGH